MELRDGMFWLGRLGDALVVVAKFMALQRYNAAPDVEDRISDALVALVEGAHRFEPRQDKDGLGYFLQYVLSFVSGALRNGAQIAKGWGEEVVFTDVDPEQLGIEYLWEAARTGQDDEPTEALFVINNGMVASTVEIIDLITSDDRRRAVAARLLELKPDDRNLPTELLRALDAIAAELSADPRWREDPPEPEPVCPHEVALPVFRNGVQVGSASAAEIEAASRASVRWLPEDLADAESRHETDNPWPSWLAADTTRSYRSPYLDDETPDAHLQGFIDGPVWAAWEAWHADRVARGRRPGAGPLLDAMAGAELWLADEEQDVVDTMLALSERLADEPDGVANRVACDLAEALVCRGLVINTQGRLRFSFRELFGVDGTADWREELPSADSLRGQVEDWVQRAKRHLRWPSQRAALDALVLHGASPSEARAAARQAYRR